jgi:hypothetical protein
MTISRRLGLRALSLCSTCGHPYAQDPTHTTEHCAQRARGYWTAINAWVYMREVGMPISDHKGDPDTATAEMIVASHNRQVAIMEGRFDRAEFPWSLEAHIDEQRRFSRETFGPGGRTAGISDHIRKELLEIEAKPQDLMEWVDVITLAIDGAWRAGWSPRSIVEALAKKLVINKARTWPNWRDANPLKAIQHQK